MTTSLRIDSLEVAQAKHGVEAHFGKAPQVPSDFALLSLAIEQVTQQSINPDTLSRIWGYKTGYASVRKTTIDILRAYANAHVESDFIMSQSIQADAIQIGEHVQMAWLPDRECVIEYLGNYQWKVISVANSKLQVGDTFFCRLFTIGEPLLIDHLHTQTGDYDAYEIGGHNGLTILTIV